MALKLVFVVLIICFHWWTSMICVGSWEVKSGFEVRCNVGHNKS